MVLATNVGQVHGNRALGRRSDVGQQPDRAGGTFASILQKLKNWELVTVASNIPHPGFVASNQPALTLFCRHLLLEICSVDLVGSFDENGELAVQTPLASQIGQQSFLLISFQQISGICSERLDHEYKTAYPL